MPNTPLVKGTEVKCNLIFIESDWFNVKLMSLAWMHSKGWQGSNKPVAYSSTAYTDNHNQRQAEHR